MSVEYTKSELIQWGIWSRQAGLGLGYPVEAIEPETANITDERAMEIDGCMTRLGRQCSITKTCLELYFIARLNYHDIAERFRFDRRRVANIVSAGIHWIDGALYNAEE